MVEIVSLVQLPPMVAVAGQVNLMLDNQADQVVVAQIICQLAAPAEVVHLDKVCQVEVDSLQEPVAAEVVLM
tara:strand:- start:358 stop:573 length:216 start_codon:yes stop_codon:yes gene_type:complete